MILFYIEELLTEFKPKSQGADQGGMK